ncbi:hypothetical protein OZX61_12865 (plasmid) [Acinetobacter sp. ESL0695]|uniref:hypothetical protein n=1 Tax=Acinetobacter sp. ESL0695 TaxID=2983215 RepID=UPI0023F033DB|nr:hypothetical protein [Acinetobacter sp. ESL0695]WEV50233.1 hypothetical protein OZX61_12865 [Acinetobacter sp. ESL0695]
MPTISVTQEEYEAIMFYRYETMDKAQSADDEQYISDYNHHCNIFENFIKKYHNAKNQGDARKLVKKALKIAKSKGIS